MKAPAFGLVASPLFANLRNKVVDALFSATQARDTATIKAASTAALQAPKPATSSPMSTVGSTLAHDQQPSLQLKL